MFDNKTIKILEKYLNKSIEKAGKLIADNLLKKLNGLPSEYYERTWQTVEAFRNPKKVTIGSSGKVNFDVFNSLYSHSFRGSQGMFNHHMSLDGSSKWKGSPIVELVPVWLDEGFKLPNGKRWEGLNYIESALGNKSVSEYIGDDLIESSIEEMVQLIIKEMMEGGTL